METPQRHAALRAGHRATLQTGLDGDMAKCRQHTTDFERAGHDGQQGRRHEANHHGRESNVSAMRYPGTRAKQHAKWGRTSFRPAGKLTVPAGMRRGNSNLFTYEMSVSGPDLGSGASCTSLSTTERVRRKSFSAARATVKFVPAADLRRCHRRTSLNRRHTLQRA